MRKIHHSALAIPAILLLPALGPGQSAKRALDATTYIEVSHEVLPSVVNISIDPAKSKTGDDDFDAMMNYFQQQGVDPMSSELPSWMQAAISASGVVFEVKDDVGYVITNNHVVENTRHGNMDVKLTFHQRAEGSTDYNLTTVITGDDVRVAGADDLMDLAVIEFKIPPDLKVKPIEFADSDKVEIGENVIAMGNPLGFNHSITQGIISGKARDLGTKISISKLFQTSVVIQPGNSGGPLVNLDGKIVGINNAILSGTGFWQGTSFAIPGNDAKTIAEQIVSSGRAMYGYLGVTMEPLARIANGSESDRAKYKLYGLESPKGVWISTVVRNSPADIAGVHSDDIVTEIDGKPIANTTEMLRYIAGKPIDSEIGLGIVRLRDGKPEKLTMTAKLAERPEEDIITRMHLRKENSNENVTRLPESADKPTDLYLGMDIEPVYDKETRTGGLRVKAIDGESKPAAGGVQSDDVLLALNGRAVRSIPDFLDAMAQPIDGKHSLRFIHQGQEKTIEFAAD
ncbi:trypsin-like peptidase domain-containing protein [Candidatus Sumerlaeota bacterium]|nr:trypsin-like peptidase domain-containing protein [Candidatus Sumerlaeota bacterium]